MNINLRALIFGTAVAAALTTAMNVVAAETPQVIRLEGVEVIAHRDVADADAAIVHLEGVVVTAHKNAK
jgi:hypothetical protein